MTNTVYDREIIAFCTKSRIASSLSLSYVLGIAATFTVASQPRSLNNPYFRQLHQIALAAHAEELVAQLSD